MAEPTATHNDKGSKDEVFQEVFAPLGYLDLAQLDNLVVERDVTTLLKHEKTRRQIAEAHSLGDDLRGAIVKIQMDLEKASEQYNNEFCLRSELIEQLNSKRESKQLVVHILEAPETKYRKVKSDAHLSETTLANYREEVKNLKASEAALAAKINDSNVKITLFSKFADQHNKDFNMAEDSKAKLSSEAKDNQAKGNAEYELEKNLLEARKSLDNDYGDICGEVSRVVKLLTEQNDAPRRFSLALECEKKLAEEEKQHDVYMGQFQAELETELKVMESSMKELEENEVEYTESVELEKDTEEEYWNTSHDLEILIEENYALDQDDGQETVLQDKLATVEASELNVKNTEADYTAKLEKYETEYEKEKEAVHIAERSVEELRKELEKMNDYDVSVEEELMKIEQSSLNLEGRVAESEVEMKKQCEEAEASVLQLESDKQRKADEIAENCVEGNKLDGLIAERTGVLNQLKVLFDDMLKNSNSDADVKRLMDEEKLQRERFEAEIRARNENLSSLYAEIASSETQLKKIQSEIHELGEANSLKDDIKIIQERTTLENKKRMIKNEELKGLAADEKKLGQELRKINEGVQAKQREKYEAEKETEKLRNLESGMDEEIQVIQIEKEKLGKIKWRSGVRHLLAEKDKLESSYENELQRLERKVKNKKPSLSKAPKTSGFEQLKQFLKKPDFFGKRQEGNYLSQPTNSSDPDWFQASQRISSTQLTPSKLQNEQVTSSSNFQFRVPARKAGKKRLFNMPSPHEIIDII